MSLQEEIIAAVKARDGARVRALLEEDPSLASSVTENGSIILTAVFYGAKEALDALMAEQPDLDILEAAAVGRADVVRHWLAGDAGLLSAEHLKVTACLGSRRSWDTPVWSKLCSNSART